MNEQVIICPYCQREIPLTEAISHQIRERLEKEFEAEVNKKEQELALKEQSLLKKEKAIAEEVSQKVTLEKKKLEEELNQKAKEAVALELEDLRSQLKEKGQKLEESVKAELELRKQRRELEERQKSLELEVSRKLDEEREKVRQEAIRSFTEEHRLKDLEKDKQIKDMLKQIEDLRRKAEQGPVQLKGEVLELELEDILKEKFPLDQIEPVPKGMRGADILQRVHNQNGQYCGTIIWESKRTKAWNDAWIEKLKDDQREAKAEIAALVTTVLPKEVSNFTYAKGVWIADYSLAQCLALALRMNLIQVASAKTAAVGRSEKMEFLYNYLSGPAFAQKVEAMVTAFTSMKTDLDKEKKAIIKIWGKRERQIERVVTNLSGMYGDVAGIIGASLPEIKSLELKGLIAEGDSDERAEDHQDNPARTGASTTDTCNRKG